MSLLHRFEDAYFPRPSQLLDQHFGMILVPDDFEQALEIPRMIVRSPAGYIRNWRSTASRDDTGSRICSDKDKFQATLDVQHFKPEEITVKVTGENVVTVEGKHEEKEDEHGHIYRHFVRKYMLPKNSDMGKIESKLSSDGILTITAPKIGDKEIDHKEIPITYTKEPAKAVEQPKAGDKK